MKVRLGQLEFVDLSPEELDALVQRYGCVPDDDADRQTNVKAGQKTAEGGPRDFVVLRAFVEAGTTGVPTTRIGSLLGRGGKAIRAAARLWAMRVGLTHGETSDPFEECRVGTSRGIRIKLDLQDLAKELYAMRKG